MVMFVPVANEIMSPNEPVTRFACRVSVSSVLYCTVAPDHQMLSSGRKLKKVYLFPDRLSTAVRQYLVFGLDTSRIAGSNGEGNGEG